VEVRGNVGTRIGLVRSGSLDAAVLAVAGIARLGRSDEIDRILPSAKFVPAPAQGALAVVARADDPTLPALARQIDHPPTRACVTAERTLAAALGGDCQIPLGALATLQGRELSLVGEVLTPDGRSQLRRRRRGRPAEAATLGSRLGRELIDRGALDLLASRPR